MWLFRFPDCLNDLSHKWHLYGFSPWWILLCWTRLADCVNRLLQTVHSNGFSPEWRRLCTVKLLLWWKHLPHSVHLYLPLWTFICALKEPWFEKHFSHWVQEYDFVVCDCLWTSKYSFVVNHLSHNVHKYSFSLSSCCCWVLSLLSTWVSTAKEFRPALYEQYVMLCMCCALCKFHWNIAIHRNVLKRHAYLLMVFRWQSYGKSPAIWDHSVTCYLTQVNAPHPNPSLQAGTWFTYPRGMEGWVDLGYPAVHWPGLELATSRSHVRRPNHYTTEMPQYLNPSVLHFSRTTVV